LKPGAFKLWVNTLIQLVKAVGQQPDATCTAPHQVSGVNVPEDDGELARGAVFIAPSRGVVEVVVLLLLLRRLVVSRGVVAQVEFENQNLETGRSLYRCKG
jgi:hypothetical protein